MEDQLSGGVGVAGVAQPPAGPGWGWGDLAAAIVTAVVGGVAVILLGRLVLGLIGGSADGSLVSPVAYGVGIGLYLAALLGVYLFGARRAGWAALGLRPYSNRSAILLPLIFILGIAGLIFVNLLIASFVGEFENPQVEALTGGEALTPGELIALLLLVAGLVPFVEELFFRGMLYPLLRARLAAPVAITINALLFAAIHVIPLLLPGLFVVGLCLAYLRERSGSIWPSVIFHVMQNGMALLLINTALSMQPGQ